MSYSDGTIFKSQLSILQLIGSGGYSRVFKAKDLIRKHLVAVKTMFTSTDISEKDAKVMLKEAENLAGLRCPYIGQLFGVCFQPGYYALVLEYHSHGSLYLLLKNHDVSWCLRWRMVHEIILGMIYLHSKDILHLDLKAQNTLLDEYFHIKICDFGLSRSGLSLAQDLEYIRGTVTHLAPESFRKSPINNHKQLDVYSFGILLWEIITTKQPYENFENVEELVDSICYRDVRPDLKMIRGDIPSDYEVYLVLVPLMVKCWDRNPNNRGSFPEFADISESRKQKYSKRAKMVARTLSDDMGVADEDQDYSRSTQSLDEAVTGVSANFSRSLNTGSFTFKTSEEHGSGLQENDLCLKLSRVDSKALIYKSDFKYQQRGVRLKSSYDFQVGIPTQCVDNQTNTISSQRRTSNTCKIPIKDPNRVLSQEDMVYLSGKIGKRWISLARKLDFWESEIETISYDHSYYGDNEMAYQMLRSWKEKLADTAVVKTLAKACASCGQQKVIQSLNRL